ncbi:hypothetical protein O3M35_003773 [Rhynocoris fuscipes]|uniref:Protein YIF1 n=1 Tax=Rhynocoris fuscipes TaxID=488301 RepID=A0AAW1CMY4_9HEMI
MNVDNYWPDQSGQNLDVQSQYQPRKGAKPKLLGSKISRSQPQENPTNSAFNALNETNIPYSQHQPYYQPQIPPQLDPAGFNVNVGRNPIPQYEQSGQSFDSMYSQQGYSSFPANPLMADLAFRYGSNFVDSGKEIVDKELNKYVSISRIKSYFDVDTKYAAKKLFIIIFPFANQTWLPKNIGGAPNPREDINSPDLYIPLMAYLTYVLLAGLVIGMKSEFRPEVLGILASQALACILVEVIVELITIFITNLQTHFCTYDLLAFSGYKFIGLTIILALRWLFDKTGYYIALIYCGLALSFFLIRTLKWRMINESVAYEQQVNGDQSLRVVHQGKRRLYLLITIAFSQPLLLWWLSNNLEKQIKIA